MLTTSDGSWNETVLYDFTGESDGGGLEGGVIFDNAGSLYGVAASGGAYSAGTVYRLTPSNGGWTEETLHTFQNASDGSFPDGSLLFDAAGNLYGTTLYGGLGGGGTVFELTPSNGNWTHTVLYGFTGTGGSFGTVTMDPSGNLYGTTFADGKYGYGMVFKVTPSSGSWTLTDLHDFTGGADGQYPDCAVTLDAHGNLYGTATAGGTNDVGVIWEITP